MGRPFINSTRRTDISSTLKGEGKGGCEEVEEEVEEEEEEEEDCRGGGVGGGSVSVPPATVRPRMIFDMLGRFLGMRDLAGLLCSVPSLPPPLPQLT